VKVNELSIIVGGQAGDGITQAGVNLGLACLRGGLHVFGANDYQSLIRGGHNFYILRISGEKIFSQTDFVDLLLSLNEETITLHKDELTAGAGIIYDGEEVTLNEEEFEKAEIKLFPIPLMKIVRDLNGPSIARNSVIVGATISLVNYDLELLLNTIKESFEGKEKVATLNMNAAKAGYDYMEVHYKNKFDYKLEKLGATTPKRMMLTGAEAIGLGAIQACCKFYAGYPMTPTTPLLHFMASLQREYNMIVIQVESEIAAINMIVGASFAGARAMTATSGGGFCLMSEGLGMAGMTETPVVIMLGQRPGPSTGLPTYTSQGDLRFAIHAGQGEFPRVIIAPGDVAECFYKTMEAFNLAERYQIPAIIITDKYLLESHESAEFFDTSKVGVDRGLLISGEYLDEVEYKRYKITENGISPRAVPLTKNTIVRANSDEHNEAGYTTENPQLTTQMTDKRYRKLEALTKELESMETIKTFGAEKSDATIIGWGSTKGPILEAMKILEKEGLKANYLQVIYIAPFPAAKVSKILENANKTVIVENNKTAQLAQIIKEKTKFAIEHAILKYDGRPFNPVSLSKQIEEVF